MSIKRPVCVGSTSKLFCSVPVADLEPRRRVERPIDELRVGDEIEFLRHALRERAAFEQADLRGQIVAIGDRLRALESLDDLDRRRVDLEHRRRAVDRRRQQGQHDRAGQADRDRAEDQPAPFGYDAQERREIEVARDRTVIAPLAPLIGEGEVLAGLVCNRPDWRRARG